MASSTHPSDVRGTDARSTDVLINFVLDSSGSMSHLADATVLGVNAFVEDQKQGSGTALMSLTLFDTGFDVRFVALDVREMPPLGSPGNRYVPHGGTALYDAVVTTVRGAEAWLAHHREFTGDVVTVIQTDGAENSSRTTTLSDVNALISHKTRQGWEFVFQGTGQAAWTEAEKFSSIPVSARFAGAATAGAQRDAYASNSRAMTRKRRTGERFDDSLRLEGMPDEQHR